MDRLTSKLCAKCKVEKPLFDFHRQPSGPMGRHSYCKLCANTLAKEKRVRHDTPEKRRRWNLSTRYGMSDVQYQKMMESQKGNCAICQKKMARPVIDHCHKTGKVRELLCHKCNITLHSIENTDHLELALEYIRKHK